MADKITLDQLRREQCFLALTDKQKLCVEVYLECGDKLKAVQASYACRSKQSAKVLTYSVFQNPRVVSALAVANGEDAGLVAFKANLERAVLNPKLTIAQAQALKLYAQLHGYLKAPAPEPSTVSVVGFTSEDVVDAGPYVDLPDAALPAQGLQRISEFEREAMSASGEDSPHAPHLAMIRRDDFCQLLTWRQAGATGNFWDGEKEQRYQAALHIERDYWKSFGTRESAEFWTYPIKVGGQWAAATLALAASELGLGDLK